ncbi:MAG: putative endonuclease [Flavobacterium sp.]|jgi:putative endonuclease
MAEHNDLGKLGEEMAVDFLQKNGYTILEKNWVFQKAEIDIIAEKGAVLVIVEVKTRTTADFGTPQDFVKETKIQNLVKAVNEYVQLHDVNHTIRFDIIAITQKPAWNIEHIEDAFYYF